MNAEFMFALRGPSQRLFHLCFTSFVLILGACGETPMNPVAAPDMGKEMGEIPDMPDMPDMPDVPDMPENNKTSAALVLSLEMLNFGSLLLGETSPASVFTVTNTGEASTTAVEVSLEGSDFALSADTCAGVTILSGGSCTIEVTFSPSEPGERVATLAVSASNGGNVSASLVGLGEVDECDGPGVSRGMLGDPKLNNVPPGVTRVLYAGATPEDSQRCNALGDAQVLYYDVYPAPTTPAEITVIYLHGGGYNVGYANNGDIAQASQQLRDLGAQVISIEYRRGFTESEGEELPPARLVDMTAEDAANFRVILEMAKQDVLDAWDHLHNRRTELGLPDRYVLIGESAGGSLVSRVTLTNAALDKNVLGVVAGFGTHEYNEPVVSTGFPVVIQGGLMDPISPVYSNHIWFDEDMPKAKGLFELRDELLGLNVPVRLYINGQQGHGFGSYRESGTILHYADSLQFFRDEFLGNSPESFTEWSFVQRDCDIEPNIQAGDRLRTPEFRYDPRQEQLRNGAHPDEVVTAFGQPQASCI